MKARIDLRKCSGQGTCNEVCPEVFHLDEWGYAYLNNDNIPDDYKDKVKLAETECPEKAIIITDETNE